MTKSTENDVQTPETDAVALFSVGGIVKTITLPSGTGALEDHLASVLQVKNLVLFIGSGASFHLGSPRTRELNNAAVENLVKAAGGELGNHDRKLLASINPADSGDLEKLLNSLQLASALAAESADGSVSLSDGSQSTTFALADLEGLRGQLNRALAFACNLPSSSVEIADPYEAHRTLLMRVAAGRREGLPRPKIFTTNYDLVIERALDQLGYPYIDGFSGTIERRLNLAYYGLDFHRVDVNSQSVVSRASAAYYLHKIHGSLNWRSTERTDAVSGINSFDVVQTHNQAPEGDGSVLIYPTAAKEGDSLAYPYSDLMRLLSDALQQPDTAVLCLGYGFRDAHINRILLRNLALNPGLSVTVADPSGVFKDDAITAAAKNPQAFIGKSINTIAEPGDSPIARLATAQDPRLAVVTGRGARFQDFVNFLPDPRVTATAPAAVNDMVTSLDISGLFRGKKE